ncbi:DUF411 domain-containing protein [Stappia sp. ICDLI1TA098]
MTLRATLSLIALLPQIALAQPAMADETAMTVFKSPWCGCCEAWSEAMRAAGFSVTIEDREDLAPIKSKAGVPADMEGCHTAMIGGYFVEGHVPVASVRRLLSQRPDVAGIAVPGMPAGSTGMGDDPQASYVVMAVGRNGNASLYERIGPR